MSKLTKHKNGSTTAYNRQIRKDNKKRPCIMLIDGVGIDLESSYDITVSKDTNKIYLVKVKP
jgi:hypothetical protein